MTNGCFPGCELVAVSQIWTSGRFRLWQTDVEQPHGVKRDTFITLQREGQNLGVKLQNFDVGGFLFFLKFEQ